MNTKEVTKINKKNSKENQQTGEAVLKFGLSVKIDGNFWQKCSLKQGSSCSLPNFRQGKKSKSLLTEEQFPIFWTNCTPVASLGQKAQLMDIHTVSDPFNFHSLFPGTR